MKLHNFLQERNFKSCSYQAETEDIVMPAYFLINKLFHLNKYESYNQKWRSQLNRLCGSMSSNLNLLTERKQVFLHLTNIDKKY